MTALPASIQFADTSLSIIDRNGTPWLASRDLALALGYNDERAVARIYRRHANEFCDAMTCGVKLTPQGEQAREVRIFSPRGAHLIAMFARTERAGAFRRWVLDVLEGIATPPATPTLVPIDSPEELALRCLVSARFMLVFGDDGRPSLRAVPPRACVIDANHQPSLETFLREYLPAANLPLAMQVLTTRLTRYLPPPDMPRSPR